MKLHGLDPSEVPKDSAYLNERKDYAGNRKP